MVIVSKSIEEMFEDISMDSFLYYEMMPSRQAMREGFDFRKDILMHAGLDMPAMDWMDLQECVALALENAWMHGTQGQGFPGISIKAFRGEKGLIVRIRDPGEGFGYKVIQRKYSLGQVYYTNMGWGFRRFNEFSPEVSFENNGTTINLMYTRPS